MTAYSEQTVQRLRSRSIVTNTGCWEWLGYKDKDGYGQIGYLGQRHAAHRVSFILRNPPGALPPGGVVRHKCDNPSCINPYHLEVGTHADNVEDKIRRGRQPSGEEIANSKLTKDDVRYVKFLIESQYYVGMLRDLAAEYGVDPSTISNIKKGRTWKNA